MMASPVQLEKADTKSLGIIFGFTGPIESLTPPMAEAAEMAMKEVTDSGAFMERHGRHHPSVPTRPALTPRPQQQVPSV